MSELSNTLKSAKCILKKGLHSTYNQISLDINSRGITAFVVLGKGMVRFIGMSYGLCNAAATL